MLLPACADALMTAEQIYLAFRHPRRKAGPQSHGTPAESAGLQNRATTLISAPGPWRPRDVVRAARPSVRTLHVRPDPFQRAGVPARARRRPRLRRDSGLPRRPPPSASAPPSRSSCSPARPSPTPARRCSTATSGSPRARRSPASACPPSSTAPRTPPTRVAAQAQLDLTTAYNVAAGQPVSPANDLTGTDLGNRSAEGRRLSLHVVGPAHRPADARRRRATRTRSSCSRSPRR